METAIAFTFIIIILYFFVRIYWVYGRAQEWNFFIEQYTRDYMVCCWKYKEDFIIKNKVSEMDIWKIILNPFKVHPNRFFKYKHSHKVIITNYLK